MLINLSEFIKYIKKIKEELIKKGYSKILIEETIQVVTKNWVDTSNPSLREKQLFKITCSSLVKTKLNLN
tara:strand:+ start:178 stop:387 length:210 start_codon:yes stop_codon:yes gene_type:complete